MITFKEVPERVLQPASIKAVLDPNDCKAEARANNSKPDDEITFDITWAIVAQSQTALSIAQSSGTTGLEGKLCEVHFQKVFKAETDPTFDDHLHYKVDPNVKLLTDSGSLVAEMLLRARAFGLTLLDDVCPGRHIVPAPSEVQENEEFALAASSGAGRLRKWLLSSCVGAESSADATPIDELKQQAESVVGFLDKHAWATIGLNNKVRKYRRADKAHFYVFRFPGDDTLKPIKLK